MLVVSPKYLEEERRLLKQTLPFEVDEPIGSGVMISECHALTNMHVLFQPWDLLSVDRELERQATVVGQRLNGERVASTASVVMNSPNFWVSSKPQVQLRYRAFGRYYRHHEDIVLLKVKRVVIRDTRGTFRNQDFGKLLGWYVPAWSTPTEREFMIGGVNARPYYGKGGASIKPQMKAYVDKRCRANWLVESDVTHFRGDCNVTSGMSGGPLVAMSAPRKLYGLAQGANIKFMGSPPRELNVYDSSKFKQLELNYYLAVWPHRERILKAMKEHPCEQ